MNITWWKGLFLFFSVFVLTIIFERLLIPALRRRHAGQHILEIGPAWHKEKEGTPTMGGLGFMAAFLITVLLFGLYCFFSGEKAGFLPLALLSLFAFLCGAVGFVDDYCKLVKGKNQGLTAPEKFFLLLLVSALFLFVCRYTGCLDGCFFLPFGKELNLGFFYDFLALIYLVFMVNALNLTDGLDGLLSCVTAVFSAFLLVFGLFGQKSVLTVTGIFLLAACLGFLLFNHHPAKVFMGDTGSLFLGGAVAAAGLLSGCPIAVFVAEGVYVLEAASVVLQVVFFRLTHGKRLFRMAPLHHHFEKLGMKENGVVALFSLSALLFAVLAFFLR